jgi:hypothetical protein
MRVELKIHPSQISMWLQGVVPSLFFLSRHAEFKGNKSFSWLLLILSFFEEFLIYKEKGSV